MSATAESIAELDLGFAEQVLERVATDIALIIDHDFQVESVTHERVTERTAGAGDIHISFKLAFQVGGKTRHGCLLIPLPDAMALAGFLMMVPDEAARQRRADREPDQMTKDALLELANFIAAAVEGALKDDMGVPAEVRSDGCQGVRADVRPAFPYTDGDELLSVTARTKVHDFPVFDLIMLVPVMEGLVALGDD